jgi:hypothetical protein
LTAEPDAEGLSRLHLVHDAATMSASAPLDEGRRMGLFGKAKRELGITDKKLLRNGVLARGSVVSCEPDGMTIGDDANLAYGPEKVCRVVVEVSGIDGVDPYQATCKHAIPLIYIPKMQEAGATIAVRVDPHDPQHIELDLATEPPAAPIILETEDGTQHTLTTNRSTYTAAQILHEGAPCTVEVLAVIPMDQSTSEGPATGLILTVHRDGVPEYQAQVGTFIPPAAVAKVVVGATLPARWVPGPGLPTDVNLVIPDWAAIAA